MTNQTFKANDNKVIDTCERVILPLPALDAESAELEVYGRFMRHLRMVPNSRMDIKILSAIQFTSDMMDMNDAIVAKSLADMGLRAPRRAFPESYLEHVDRSMMRSGFEVGAPCQSALAMKSHWDKIGEDRFAAFNRQYTLSEPLNV
jgi:hypothetical protein